MPQNPVFECLKCGQCCEGKGGIILSEKDLQRLAAFFKSSAETIIQKYAEISNGKLKIKNGPGGHCIFFRAGCGCSAHVAKPDICRAWPFFRGNLEDPLSFGMAKDFCPGINREASFEQFVAEGLAYLRENNLIAHDCEKEANSLVIRR